MHGDSIAEERDLRIAAEIFLRGPVPVGARPSSIEISAEAIARVAQHLAASDPAAVANIRAALHWFQRLGTTASREVVIEAVTAAVAHPDRRGADRSRTARQDERGRE